MIELAPADGYVWRAARARRPRDLERGDRARAPGAVRPRRRPGGDRRGARRRPAAGAAARGGAGPAAAGARRRRPSSRSGRCSASRSRSTPRRRSPRAWSPTTASRSTRPVGSVTHLFPSAAALAAADPERLAMPGARRRALLGLCAALAARRARARAGRRPRRAPGGGCSRCRGSARGPPSYVRCARSATPTRCRRPTSGCAGRSSGWARTRARRRASPGRALAAVPRLRSPSTCGRARAAGSAVVLAERPPDLVDLEPGARQASSFIRAACGERKPAGMIPVSRRSRSDPR